MAVHTIGEIETRRNLNVLRGRECSSDGYRVLDAILPIAEDIFLSKLVFLGCDLVGHIHVVGHRDFLVPTIGATLLLALEGIPGAHRGSQLRQCDHEGGVSSTLCNTRRCRQIPFGIWNLVACIDC